MNTSKQIKFGAILSYGSIAVNIITGFLYTPWMVASIGKSQYGLYTLAHSVITLFLMDFGLSSATGKYLSKYNATEDREGAERFLGAVYKLYLLIDLAILVVLIVIFLLMDRIFINLTVEEMEQFRVVYAISAIFSVINFPFVTFNGILTAYERFVPLKIADLLYRLGNVCFTVIALRMGYGLYALVTVHAVVGLLVLIFKYIVIKRSIPIQPNFKCVVKDLYKEIFGFSIWMTVATISMHLMINITPSILGVVANSAAIAVFGVVTTVDGYSQTITTALNGLFLARISRIMASDEKLNPLFLSVGKYQYALNGLIVAGFAVVGRSFVIMWMGEEFSLAYYGILLLLIPALFFNSLQIASTAMIVANKIKPCAIIHLISGIINVLASFALSKSFGVVGACMSICIAYLIRAILFNILYHRELPLDIPRFIKECYVRMSIPIVLTIICGSIINRYIADGGWKIFFIKAALTVMIYGVSTLFLALSKQERKKVLHWIRR